MLTATVYLFSGVLFAEAARNGGLKDGYVYIAILLTWPVMVPLGLLAKGNWK